MDEVIDYQLLLKSVQANDCFSRDKKINKTSDGKFLHNSVRTRNYANRDKKIEEMSEQIRIFLPADSPGLINFLLSRIFLRNIYDRRRLE